MIDNIAVVKAIDINKKKAKDSCALKALKIFGVDD